MQRAREREVDALGQVRGMQVTIQLLSAQLNVAQDERRMLMQRLLSVDPGRVSAQFIPAPPGPAPGLGPVPQAPERGGVSIGVPTGAMPREAPPSRSRVAYGIENGIDLSTLFQDQGDGSDLAVDDLTGGLT